MEIMQKSERSISTNSTHFLCIEGMHWRHFLARTCYSVVLSGKRAAAWLELIRETVKTRVKQMT